MSISSRRPRRFTGAVVAGMALLLVPAGFTAAQAAPAPAPVSNLRVVTEPASPAGELTVAWNASPSDNVSEYMIEVENFQGPDDLDYNGPDELTFTVTDLDPGQAVRVTVTALSISEEGGDGPASTPVSIVANTLGDVNEDGTFFDTVGNTFEYQIAWLATTGITTGYADGTFRPSAPVLREQMAAFLFRLSNVDEDYEAPAISPFTDVPTTATFYREISWLAQTGISTGYANGDGTRSFGPSQPVLREQMAAFLYRAFGFEYSHGFDPASFADTPRSSTFFNEIEFMALVNITTGYQEANGTLTFRGSQPVLREQMAAFLYRTIGVVYQLEFNPEFSVNPAAPIPAPEEAPVG